MDNDEASDAVDLHAGRVRFPASFIVITSVSRGCLNRPMVVLFVAEAQGQDGLMPLPTPTSFVAHNQKFVADRSF